MKPAQRRALEEAKRANVGQLLLRSARLLDELAIARLNQEAGAAVLRPAHTKLLPHIDFEGTRVGTIALRLGVTKQAVSELVAELAELGFLALVPDPADGRAKLVRFTPRGVEGIKRGLEVLGQLERELAAEIGEDLMRALGRALAALTPALERKAAGGSAGQSRA
jgi:DNA-binding MarR family transcriptional regulator